MTRGDGTFPHPDYARYVLGPAFEESRRLLFPHMMAANEAHTLMLAATGILRSDEAAPLLAAIRQVRDEGPDALGLRPAELAVLEVDVVHDLRDGRESVVLGEAGPRDEYLERAG